MLQASADAALHRSEFDVSIVVDADVNAGVGESKTSKSSVRPLAKRGTLMCYKGTRWGRYDTAWVRDELDRLYNGDDVKFVSKCGGSMPEDFIACAKYSSKDNATWRVDWRGDPIAPGMLRECLRCEALARAYARYDYSEMLDDCVFTIVPRGIGVYAKRIYEVLARGSIPVVLSNRWVLPLAGARGLSWGNVSLRFNERNIPGMLRALRELRATRLERLERMQAEGGRWHAQYFSTRAARVRSALELLRANIWAHGPPLALP